MPDALTILTDWTDVAIDPTAARLAIEVAGKNTCRIDNHWSRSVDEAAHLSAHPLALWLAGSWWRLRWEGSPVSNFRSHSWRMAHEVAASGGGFLWPRLTFISDGETVRAECRQSDPSSPEMFRYISNFDEVISVAAFETGIEDFIELVLERLGPRHSSDLRELWNDVLAERADPQSARYRHIEAMLGFDPDEGSDDFVKRLLSFSGVTGEATAAEIAAICGGSTSANELSEVMEVANGEGLSGQVLISFPPDLLDRLIPAHERGHRCANWMREQANIDGNGSVSDQQLGEMLGLTSLQIEGSESRPRKAPPLSLAIHQKNQRYRYFFRGWRVPNRRFEAARMLFDSAAQKEENWHPATSAYTARQKAQRAFAAEFLAPISAIRDYLDKDYSIDAIEGAGEYFDVTSYTIASQLANHGDISRDHPAVPTYA